MTGDAAGAAQAFADLLELVVRVLGAHPGILATRNNLDHWRKEAERTPDPSGNDCS